MSVLYMSFKIGDIVVLQADHWSHFTTRDVFHPIGTRFRIVEINTNTGSVISLDDDIGYFVFGEFFNKLISLEKWREIQLNSILEK